MSLITTDEELLSNLRRQHKAFEREGYDGHNRRSGLTTMHRLAMRRLRRRWHRFLAQWSRV